MGNSINTISTTLAIPYKIVVVNADDINKKIVYNRQLSRESNLASVYSKCTYSNLDLSIHLLLYKNSVLNIYFEKSITVDVIYKVFNNQQEECFSNLNYFSTKGYNVYQIVLHSSVWHTVTLLQLYILFNGDYPQYVINCQNKLIRISDKKVAKNKPKSISDTNKQIYEEPINTLDKVSEPILYPINFANNTYKCLYDNQVEHSTLNIQGTSIRPQSTIAYIYIQCIEYKGSTDKVKHFSTIHSGMLAIESVLLCTTVNLHISHKILGEYTEISLRVYYEDKTILTLAIEDIVVLKEYDALFSSFYYSIDLNEFKGYIKCFCCELSCTKYNDKYKTYFIYKIKSISDI